MAERPDPTPWCRFGYGWQRTLRSPLVDAEVLPLGDGDSWQWTVTDPANSKRISAGTTLSEAEARAEATAALLRLQHEHRFGSGV